MGVSVPPLEELDRWLAAREETVVGLKPGVAAGIIWADPNHPAQTPVSIVYLHGYTASRGEIFPVPDRIAAALGANLFYARLRGHGLGANGHRNVTVEEWVEDGLEALEIGRRLGHQLVVLATSTGATLAAWLILGPPRASVAASIFVSPNLTPKNRLTELLLWPGKEHLLKAVMGDTVTIPSKNELNSRYWDLTHHSHSLLPMMALVQKARSLDFRKWPSPALVVYDPDDHVVDEKVTKKLFGRAPKALVTLHQWSGHKGEHHHVLAGEALSPCGTAPMVALGTDYLRRVLGPAT